MLLDLSGTNKNSNVNVNELVK